MPAIVEPKKKYKDVVYTGIAASGVLVTPVVFTSDKVDTHRDQEGFRVIYQENIKGPGNHSTHSYWDIVKDTDFDNQSILLLDNLKSHHSVQLTEEMEAAEVQAFYFPAHGGAILNPLDNSFHAEVKARYYRKDRSDHGLMLDAIRESIFETEESSICNYWRHCGITSDEDPATVVKRLLAEGYAPDSDRYRSEHQAMADQYDHWSLHRRLLRKGYPLKGSPVSLGFSGLDGTYWTVWNSSHTE